MIGHIGNDQKGDTLMKFIHCADLHLDAKMEAHLDTALAKQRKAELLETFDRMVDYAVREGVRAILISGDMFDTKRVTKNAANVVKNAIMLHPEIDFVYLRGNHDNAVSFLNRFEELPANLKLFEESWTSYEYDEVTITGIELKENSSSSVYDTLSLARDRVNIVMMHGMVTNSRTSGVNGEQVSLPALKGRYIDYLALGHVHSYRSERLDNRGIWAYSGCLEGRGFDELGEKGFVAVSVENGRVETTFVPFAKRTLHLVEVDLTGICASHEINERIDAALAAAAIPAKDMVRISLVGEIEMELEPDVDYLTRNFLGYYLFLKIVSNLRYAIHPEDYEHDISLKGEFVRTVLSQKRLSEEEQEAVILYGIRALAGEELI